MATHASIPLGPAPGHFVRIAVPGFERASAEVVHVTDAWLGLRLVGIGAPHARDLLGHRGAVEYMNDSGMHRLRGQVEPGDGSPHSLRFVLRNGSGPQFLGRRQHIRTVLRAPAVVTDERTGRKFRGRSQNVGEGGMLVSDLMGSLPDAGSQVRFALAPRECRDAITGTAIVLRRDNHRGTLALEFHQMTQEAADELARVVFEHEQDSRGARRR